MSECGICVILKYNGWFMDLLKHKREDPYHKLERGEYK